LFAAGRALLQSDLGLAVFQILIPVSGICLLPSSIYGITGCTVFSVIIENTVPWQLPKIP